MTSNISETEYPFPDFWDYFYPEEEIVDLETDKQNLEEYSISDNSLNLEENTSEVALSPLPTATYSPQVVERSFLETPEQILQKVAETNCITTEELLKEKKWMLQKQIAAYLCARILDVPYIAIAASFGCSEQTSSTYVRMVQTEIDYNNRKILQEINRCVGESRGKTLIAFSVDECKKILNKGFTKKATPEAQASCALLLKHDGWRDNTHLFSNSIFGNLVKRIQREKASDLDRKIAKLAETVLKERQTAYRLHHRLESGEMETLVSLCAGIAHTAEQEISATLASQSRRFN